MQRTSPETTQKSVFSSFKRTVIAVTVILSAIGLTISFSKTAHAGLFSFLSNLVGNQEVSAGTKPILVADSQVSSTIVLQASASLLQAEVASDTPPIEGDTTLSPELARMNATSTEDINTQISLYTVRQGDTISSVAKMFSVSVNTILWANDLTSKSALRAGQTLVILPVTGITYTVKKGDSIQSIAKQLHADVEDILNYNDLTLATPLQIGNQIIVPDAEITTRAVAVTPSTPRKITKAPNEPLLDGWGWPSYPGFFACPVPGATLTQDLHGHNAVDLAIARNTPLHASASGTVLVARSNGAWNGGYGNFVVILHGNGTQTLYAHMQRVSVKSGESVSRSQVIGTVGSTGLSTGPHVHFEIRGAQNPFSDQSLCR